MSQQFFFYGTLSHEMAGEVARSVNQKLTHVGAGYVVGRLYAIPHSAEYYPALIQDVNGYRVTGNIYETKSDFTQNELDTLDEYEEYYPTDLEHSEYLRKISPITLFGRETTDAYMYLYNQPLPPTAIEITGGSFATFLKKGGFKHY